jgi:hypothetical protein
MVFQDEDTAIEIAEFGRQVLDVFAELNSRIRIAICTANPTEYCASDYHNRSTERNNSAQAAKYGKYHFPFSLLG